MDSAEDLADDLPTRDRIPIINQIKKQFPKFFVTEVTNDDLTFSPEKDNGFIEYKRKLDICTKDREEKYATQMVWRINQNIKSYAVYFIGLDDDGTIIGISPCDIIDCIQKFASVAQSVNASIIDIQIINVKQSIIIKISPKIKKARSNFLVDFC